MEKEVGATDSGEIRSGKSGRSSPAPGVKSIGSPGKVKRGDLRKGKAKYQPKGPNGGRGKPPHAQQGAGTRKYQAKKASCKLLTSQLVDLVAQEKGARDALREIAIEKEEADKANLTLTRIAQEQSVELSAHQKNVEARHLKWANAFSAGWNVDAPKSWIFFLCLVPVLLFCTTLLFYCHNWVEDLTWVVEKDDARIQLFILLLVGYLWICRNFTNKYLSFKGQVNMATWAGFKTLFSVITESPPPRIHHQYKMIHLKEYRHPDLRPEAMAMRDLKQMDAIYGVVEYTVRLNGVLINVDAFGFPTHVPGQMLISMELLSQLCTPMCMQSRDEEVTKMRLESYARSYHSTNIDKYITWKVHDVVGNTTTVALGIWKQRLEQRVGYFPNALV